MTATPKSRSKPKASNRAEGAQAPVAPPALSAASAPPDHSNADPAELAKFSALAHRWWDKTSEFKPLHQINPLRLDWIAQTAGGLSSKRVVDIGCGGGILADSMARAGAQVLGIDLASKALKVAQLHAIEQQTPNITYREVSAEQLAEEQAGHYDVVTCMEMLEHVPDPSSVVRACSQLVKPGGWVFFSSINRNAKAWLMAIVGAEYVLRLLPKGTHEYAKLVKPSELHAFCRENGLNPDHMRGLKYNPLTDHYWIDRDTSVNYMMATRR